MYKTFQEWSNEGYKILKGSKASWIDGVAVFSEDQVEKLEWLSPEDDMERWMAEACDPNQ